MPSPRFQSITDQVVDYLLSQLSLGRWTGLMQGRIQLARELGVSGRTVELALKRLEGVGALASQGAGRRRKILGGCDVARTGLRVTILAYEPMGRHANLLSDLRLVLDKAGFPTKIADTTLTQLGTEVERVEQFVSRADSDAWVVQSSSRDVLRWFAEMPAPAFALFGCQRDVMLAGAGVVMDEALLLAMDRLVDLGHRRIVMLVHRERRQPCLGHLEQLFLGRLQGLGIPHGPDDVPDWDDSPADLRRCLDMLFRHTPPTVLILPHAPSFPIVQQYLARRGLRVPEDVSLIIPEPDPAFAWFDPAISHFFYDCKPWARCVVRWATKVARGEDCREKFYCQAEFVEGGTIGPVRL